MTTGPHPPKEGWLTRWPIQAGALLLRCPLASMIGLCGVLICAVIIDVFVGLLLEFLSDHVSENISLVLVSVPGVCVPVAICACLAISEGYGTVSRSDLMNGLRNILLFVFVVLFFVAIIVIFTFSEPVLNQVGMNLFFSRGVSSINAAIVATTGINVFWIPLVAQMPMSMKHVYLSGDQIRSGQQFLFPWIMMYFMILVSALFAVFTHVFISIPVMIFSIAWLYVAGREIFGGISENRAPVAETDASLARA